MHLPHKGVFVGIFLLVSLALGCGGSQNSTPQTSNTTQKTATVAVSGAAQALITLAQLSANPASMNFGSVQLGTSSTQSLVLSNIGTADANIDTLTSSDAAFRVTFPAVPYILRSGYSVTSQVQFVPSGAGNYSASIAVAVSGVPPLTVTLAGTGVFAPAPAPTPTPGQHMATLAWGASSSIVDGYNVYRGATSGGPYSRINPAPVTALLFGDTNVAAGQTYYYVVTATAAGLESLYSNEVQAVIPSP